MEDEPGLLSDTDQGGKTNSVSKNTTTPVAFPVSFSDSCFSVVGIISSSTRNSAALITFIMACDKASFSFKLHDTRGDQSGQYPIYYVAAGV